MSELFDETASNLSYDEALKQSATVLKSLLPTENQVNKAEKDMGPCKVELMASVARWSFKSINSKRGCECFNGKATYVIIKKKFVTQRNENSAPLQQGGGTNHEEVTHFLDQIP